MWSEMVVGMDRPFAGARTAACGQSGIAAGGDRGRTWLPRLYLLGLGQAEQQQACDATLDAYLLPVALGVRSLPPQKKPSSKEQPPPPLAGPDTSERLCSVWMEIRVGFKAKN